MSEYVLFVYEIMEQEICSIAIKNSHKIKNREDDMGPS